MKAIYALSVLAAAASALSFKADPFWKAYKSKFAKTYESDAEEARRYEVFNQNMQKAALYNSQETMAEYGMTVVSDRFPEEIMMNIDMPTNVEVADEQPEQLDGVPTTFDARNYGWVPAVRSQGGCGSCWAFSTTSTMAIAYAKKHSVSAPVLSEQQIVDCDTSNSGCSGGWPYKAASYAKKGIMLNSDYPYTGRADTCKYVASKVKVTTSSSGSLTQTASAMKNAIYNYGAISVVLNAVKMQSYSSGIMDGSNCPVRSTHAVTAVGWGVSGSTTYWIIRNSWGSWWGENGYLRIVAGSNACGIETWPVYIAVK